MHHIHPPTIRHERVLGKIFYVKKDKRIRKGIPAVLMLFQILVALSWCLYCQLEMSKLQICLFFSLYIYNIDMSLSNQINTVNHVVMLNILVKTLMFENISYNQMLLKPSLLDSYLQIVVQDWLCCVN